MFSAYFAACSDTFECEKMRDISKNNKIIFFHENDTNIKCGITFLVYDMVSFSLLFLQVKNNETRHCLTFFPDNFLGSIYLYFTDMISTWRCYDVCNWNAAGTTEQKTFQTTRQACEQQCSYKMRYVCTKHNLYYNFQFSRYNQWQLIEKQNIFATKRPNFIHMIFVLLVCVYFFSTWTEWNGMHIDSISVYVNEKEWRRTCFGTWLSGDCFDFVKKCYFIHLKSC